jgi:hypothetical protein
VNRPAIHPGRTVAAILLGEILPILTLVLIVIAFGPADEAGSEAFANRAGAWVGPLVGALVTFLASRWAGGVSSRPLLQGGVIGVGVAAIDLAILFGSGVPFAPLFAVSNGGKVLAGLLGGWMAGRA